MGLPLAYLNCGGNPLRSLRPLRGMAIEDLAIDGIPLTEENVQMVRELPLRHLVCDWAEQTFSLLQHPPDPQGMNQHAMTYVRRVSDVMREALAAWRHAVTGVRRPSLLPYATRCGGVRYLALPMRLSRADAEAFSRFYGGRLAAPATEEQFRALHAYLSPLVYRADVSRPPHTIWMLPPLTRHATASCAPGRRISGDNGDLWTMAAPPLASETPYFLLQPTIEQSVWHWDARFAPSISSCSNGMGAEKLPLPLKPNDHRSYPR